MQPTAIPVFSVYACCLLAGLYDLKMTTRGEMEMAYYGVRRSPFCCS